MPCAYTGLFAVKTLHFTCLLTKLLCKQYRDTDTGSLLWQLKGEESESEI